jgi:uncharacterized protein YndB with AHSA1/START domain
MSAKAQPAIAPRMSDDAVQAKTGKTWKEWFAILDKAGAAKMNHQEIVKYLHANQGVGPWWQQMVTVTYEQARGLRDLHQKPKGYEISVSRTIDVPIAKAYKYIANEKTRTAWLGENGLVVRMATPNKIMHVTWSDGKTSVAIAFLPKGDKTQVVAQHSKLPNAKASATLKAYWAKALDRLKAVLEQ